MRLKKAGKRMVKTIERQKVGDSSHLKKAPLQAITQICHSIFRSNVENKEDDFDKDWMSN